MRKLLKSFWTPDSHGERPAVLFFNRRGWLRLDPEPAVDHLPPPVTLSEGESFCLRPGSRRLSPWRRRPQTEVLNNTRRPHD